MRTGTRIMPSSCAAATAMLPVVQWPYHGPNYLHKPIRIPAGAANGLVLKNITAVAAAATIGEVIFTESNF